MTENHKHRRLSDKIEAALKQAARQGRRDLSEALRRVRDALLAEERRLYPENRRGRNGVD